MQDLLGSERDSWKNVSYSIMMVLLLGVAIFTMLFSVSPVSGTSMLNTIHDEDILLTYKSVRNIDRGDIVTAYTDNKTLVKRVIAVGGDKLVFVVEDSEDGAISPSHREVSIYIDDGDGRGYEVLIERYVYNNEMTVAGFRRNNLFDSEKGPFYLYYGDLATVTEEYIIEVPEGEYFLLGDNRDFSLDSRTYSFFKSSQLGGEVVSIGRKGTFIHEILNFYINIITGVKTWLE